MPRSRAEELVVLVMRVINPEAPDISIGKILDVICTHTNSLNTVDSSLGACCDLLSNSPALSSECFRVKKPKPQKKIGKRERRRKGEERRVANLRIDMVVGTL